MRQRVYSLRKFQAEILYCISLSIAKSMLEKGVIDEEVLAIIDTKLLEKYRSVSGILLAGKPLTECGFRVMYSSGRSDFMAKINRIEPKVPVLKKRQKVAAYACVSMVTDRLAHSLSAKVSYYSSLIQGNPEWEYAGVYADEGITGRKIGYIVEN